MWAADLLHPSQLRSGVDPLGDNPDMKSMPSCLLGRAFWDIHVHRRGTPPEVLAALGALSRRRREWTARTASSAWGLAGGRDDPPRWVVDAFDLNLSGFASFALVDYSAAAAGQLTGQLLSAVVAAALGNEAQGPIPRRTLPSS